MLGTRVQLLYAHPVTHAPCPYDNYQGGMPLLCSGPEKQPTGPISAICWLAAIPKRPEKNITATRHGSWQRGWLKQGSRGHAGDGDITASWLIYQQDDQGSTSRSKQGLFQGHPTLPLGRWMRPAPPQEPGMPVRLCQGVPCGHCWRPAALPITF